MAKKRDLKRTINYVCNDLFAETIAATLYGNTIDSAAADNLLTTIIATRNDFISRISHPEPGMKPKVYYTHVINGFNAQVSDIIDKIGNLG